MNEHYFSFLKDAYFFKDLSDDDLRKLVLSCKEERFEKGQTIFLEAAAADKFYIILEGTVEVWKDYYDSQPDLLAVHGKGHLFGEMSLVDDLPRSATVVARTPVAVLYLFKDEFQDFIMRNSRAALSVLRSVSAMVRKSNDNFVDNLRKRNAELVLAIEELKTTQERLLRSERLSNLGRFSSMIIHDIRNPVSVLRSYSEMILYQAQDPEKVKKYASNIIKETERLNRLTNELLDYTRGDIRLNMSIVQVGQLFEKVRESVLDGLEHRKISLLVDNRINEPAILDDERMLRVFINLIDNSRKALEPGGTISLSARHDERCMFFTVADNGSGMTRDIIDHLFEPFHPSAAPGGSGLGMLIVKNIIDAHGGSVDINSRLNHGTTVELNIPFRH
jgi:signal transduction histidine kinase